MSLNDIQVRYAIPVKNRRYIWADWTINRCIGKMTLAYLQHWSGAKNVTIHEFLDWIERNKPYASSCDQPQHRFTIRYVLQMHGRKAVPKA